jgi:hypothetical protein
MLCIALMAGSKVESTLEDNGEAAVRLPIAWSHARDNTSSVSLSAFPNQ